MASRMMPKMPEIPHWRIFPTFVERNGLQHVHKYHYHAGEYTPLDNLMCYFWDWCVSMTPRWVSPNGLTVAGFACVILAHLCYVFSTSPPTFDAMPPRWFYFANAICIFLYQTLDAMDGKQARKTGTCSPLGTIMDHGCDIISLPIIAFTTMGALMAGKNFISFLMIALAGQAIQFCFFWMEYQFGVFNSASGLPISIGVTEAQHSVILLNLVGGIFGGSIFTTNYLPVLPSFVRGLIYNTTGFENLTASGIICAILVVNNFFILAFSVTRALHGIYKMSGDKLDRMYATAQIFHNWCFVIAEYYFYQLVFMQLPNKSYFPSWMVLCGVAIMTCAYSILVLRLLLSSTCRYQYAAIQWPALPFQIFTLYCYFGYYLEVPILPLFYVFRGGFLFFLTLLAVFYVWLLADLLVGSWYSIAKQLNINVFNIHEKPKSAATDISATKTSNSTASMPATGTPASTAEPSPNHEDTKKTK